MTERTGDNSLTGITSTFLLEGLRDPTNQSVWRRFVDRYRPLLVRYASKLGLREDDCQDVAQQTLLAFYDAYRGGKYDRTKGRLRHWLFGIARNQVQKVFEQRRKREVNIVQETNRTDLFSCIPAEDRLQQVWEQEWQDTVLSECLQIVRQEFSPKVVEAFDLFVWQSWPAKRVAEHLGMSSNAVFIAKYRILERLRELMAQIDEA